MKKKIIVSPLNWGLGHASRCVPIIHFLLENNFTPVLASDGNALRFLQKEFPNLESLELPSYNISYKKNLKLGLFRQLPKIRKATQKEHKIITDFIVKNNDVVGIISDNRFGVRSDKIPSVYMTHQVNVLSGFTTFLTSYFHQKIINKFDECWIPDTKNHTFSGKMSTCKKLKIPIQFTGVLSRFKKEELPIKNDILILLSGIESQRIQLERMMLKVFKKDKRKVVLIQGKIEKTQTVKTKNGIKIFNYLLSLDLEREINQSEVVICRSGYSSIMDLAVLNKKVFFTPTKGQTEQEYLAEQLEAKKRAPYCQEKNFNDGSLKEVKNYKGLSYEKNNLDKDLFRLFHSK